MNDEKATPKALRKKELERKKFLLGNAFLTLSSKSKKEISADEILNYLNIKARTKQDKILVEEIQSVIHAGFSWGEATVTTSDQINTDYKQNLSIVTEELKEITAKLPSYSIENNEIFKLLSAVDDRTYSFQQAIRKSHDLLVEISQNQELRNLKQKVTDLEDLAEKRESSLAILSNNILEINKNISKTNQYCTDHWNVIEKTVNKFEPIWKVLALILAINSVATLYMFFMFDIIPTQ